MTVCPICGLDERFVGSVIYQGHPHPPMPVLAEADEPEEVPE